MSDYQPKVGDRVMVGDHGPYTVQTVDTPAQSVVLELPRDYNGFSRFGTALFSWLTPAPEPEPDEPTAFGALVRDGDGRLWVHSAHFGTNDPEWDAADRLSTSWSDLPRPITVVLANPVEVETLRAKVESSEREVKAAWGERDERQRRIYDLGRSLRSINLRMAAGAPWRG